MSARSHDFTRPSFLFSPPSALAGRRATRGCARISAQLCLFAGRVSKDCASAWDSRHRPFFAHLIPHALQRSLSWAGWRFFLGLHCQPASQHCTVTVTSRQPGGSPTDHPTGSRHKGMVPTRLRSCNDLTSRRSPLHPPFDDRVFFLHSDPSESRDSSLECWDFLCSHSVAETLTTSPCTATQLTSWFLHLASSRTDHFPIPPLRPSSLSSTPTTSRFV